MAFRFHCVGEESSSAYQSFQQPPQSFPLVYPRNAQRDKPGTTDRNSFMDIVSRSRESLHRKRGFQSAQGRNAAGDRLAPIDPYAALPVATKVRPR